MRIAAILTTAVAAQLDSNNFDTGVTCPEINLYMSTQDKPKCESANLKEVFSKIATAPEEVLQQ